MRSFWIFGILLVLFGCKTLGIKKATSPSYDSYQEDLTSSLPQYPDFRKIESQPSELPGIVSATAVDDELEIVQQRLIEKNKSEIYFSGYTVLVYSGIDRNKAFNTRDEMFQNFPELAAEMQYQEPRYLVKVGQYAYKFEAQKNFSLIKTQFPTARIIQDRFQRKEYEAPQVIDNNAEGKN